MMLGMSDIVSGSPQNQVSLVSCMHQNPPLGPLAIFYDGGEVV